MVCKRQHDVAGDNRRVDRLVRLGGVAALAGHVDLEQIGRCEEGAGADRELAQGWPGQLCMP
jgi:hypothetical protein